MGAVQYGIDTFTVGADTNIDAYPSTGARYAYNNGSGTNILVVDATDLARVNVTGTNVDARCTASGIPTGNQECEADVYCNATLGDETGRLCVRMDTGGTANYYVSYTISGPARLQIYRCDAGVFTQLASSSTAFSNGSNHTRFRAVGTGSQVDLEVQITGFAAVTASDTTANRKTSGVCGLGMFDNSGANHATVDNFSISDLNGTRQGNKLRPRPFAPCLPR